MIKYTEAQFRIDVLELKNNILSSGKKYTGIYGIPRGGLVLATGLSMLLDIPMVKKEEIQDSTLIADDLIDSGATREKFSDFDFVCLHWKTQHKNLKPSYYAYAGELPWIHYFWEGQETEHSVDDYIIRQMQYIGEDSTREGLVDTPKRIVKSWDHLYSGYKQNVEDIITVFDSDGYDEIVLLKDIEIYSMCEHHMLPFFGKAHIAYIPDKKVIGISKLARVLEVYSRRMQIQERIGEQVTAALMEYLKPKAAACIIEAQHLCMLMRGVQKQNSIMVTSSLKGAFLKKPEARKELMDLIK